MKKRKNRGLNAYNNQNFDYCSCGTINCDPMEASFPSIAMSKIQKRISANKCIACGNEICKCKSKK